MELRVATVHDRAVVADLLQRAARGLRGRRGGDALLVTWLGAREHSEALSALEEVVAPAELNVVLLGEGAGVSIAWSGEESGWFAVWVDEGHRRQGSGPRLAQAAITWLEEQGCEHIDALALPGDRDMKNVLERAGFKARLLTLRRSG